MSSNLLVMNIIEKIKRINLNSFNNTYVPSRDYITKEITKTIEESCHKSGIHLIKEYEYAVTESQRERYSRKTLCARTDFVFNRKIALEVDGGVKKWSYDKLDILNKSGMECIWFIFKRNFEPNLTDFDLYNKNILVIAHNYNI